MKKQTPKLCCPPSKVGSKTPKADAVTDADLAALAKAMGHPVRVKILRMLLSKDTCICGDIVLEVGLAQSTVSQHLKVLKQAGLIRGEIDGPKTCYCVERAALRRFQSILGAL